MVFCLVMRLKFVLVCCILRLGFLVVRLGIFFMSNSIKMKIFRSLWITISNFLLTFALSWMNYSQALIGKTRLLT